MRLILAALALGLFATAAHAADVKLSHDAREATWSKAGEVDRYRAYLTKGRDYAVGAGTLTGDPAGTYALRNPSGTVIHTGYVSDEDSDGDEFRAKVTGWHSFELRSRSGPGYPVTYWWLFDADCRGSATTLCWIKPGATQTRGLASGQESDWIKLQYFNAGQTYNVSFRPAQAMEATLSVVDGQGNVVAGPEYTNSSAQYTASLTFTYTAGSTWYVQVEGQLEEALGGSYTLQVQ